MNASIFITKRLWCVTDVQRLLTLEGIINYVSCMKLCRNLFYLRERSKKCVISGSRSDASSQFFLSSYNENMFFLICPCRSSIYVSFSHFAPFFCVRFDSLLASRASIRRPLIKQTLRHVFATS